MTRAEHYDVVIVGARCAGATLATLLARAGRRVAVVERSSFPSDTLSSHVKQADSLAFLARLGVLEHVLATGAPLTTHVDARLEHFRLITPIPVRPGDPGGGACVRRVVLDAILAEAAGAAGAELLTRTTAVALLSQGGRVSGVRVQEGPRERSLHAKLVVGADGRSSTVARLCGARRYNVLANQRAYYWSYFEGARQATPPTFVFHRWGDRFVIANPCDSGLHMVGVSPQSNERERFRRDPAAGLMAHARSCEPVAATLEGARRVGKVMGIVRFDGYFREPSGAGWVLVGDAGHFKDPAAGRGIGDAFRQVERLAPAITATLDSAPARLDGATARWGRWRDGEFAAHYWQGAEFGAAGPLPRVAPELISRLCASGGSERFVELLSHRARPSEVISPSRVLTCTGRMLLHGEHGRRELLGEVSALGLREARHRLRRHRPAYEREVGPRRSSTSGSALAPSTR